MSKREHILSPIKHTCSSIANDGTLSNKRQRSLGFENDQENQDPSRILSSPKKARKEVVKQELVVVDKNINELQDIKDPYVKFEEDTSKSSMALKELEAERQRNTELKKALAAFEAKAARRKEKKAALKKVLEAQKLEAAELKAEKIAQEEALNSEKLKSAKLEAEKMEIEEKLEKVEFHNRQISPYVIVNVMERVLSIKKTEKALSEIKFSHNGQPKLIIQGRAPVYGESKTQFNHIVPYGLVKKLLKDIIACQNTFNYKMEVLIEDTLTFFKHDKGICIRGSELESHNLKIQKVTARASIIYETKNDSYFLIENNYDDIIKNADKKHQAEESFVPRKQKFIKAALTALKNAIHDDNTKYIFCEELINFICNLFNKKTLAAYPGAGNISELEIRLYESEKSALVKRSKAFKAVTASDLNSIKDETDLNGRIRVVANSGNKVKEALKALSILNNIFEIFFEDERPNAKISDYNTKYNVQTKLSNSNPDLSAYNSDLLAKNVKTQIYYHIAKQAYEMFGLKALEQLVFSPTKEESAIKGYATAKGTIPTYYEFKDGVTYRALQKEAAKNKYPLYVDFRPEETDYDFLAIKSVDLINLINLTFPTFQTGFEDAKSKETCPIMILKAFTNLIALDYQIDHDNFFNYYISPLVQDWNNNLSDAILSDVELSGEEYSNISEYEYN